MDPSGAPFQRDIVRHPGAVAVVAVTDRDSVVLVHQYRPSVDRWLFEVPAGICDVDGEEGEATARRELAEEAGYAALEMTLLSRCLLTPGFCDEVSSVYLATGLSPVPLDRQGVEERSMRVVEVPLVRFDAMVDDGSIVDATTILGVGLARRRLGRRTDEPPAVGRGRGVPVVAGGGEGEVPQYLGRLPARHRQPGNSGPGRQASIRSMLRRAPSSCTCPSSGARAATRPRWPGPPPLCGDCSASW